MPGTGSSDDGDGIDDDGAIAYDRSKQIGHQRLRETITARHSTCPDTDLLIVGYSQGASIAGDVLAEIAADGSVPPDRISGILYSDPRDTRGVETLFPGPSFPASRSAAGDTTSAPSPSSESASKATRCATDAPPATARTGSGTTSRAIWNSTRNTPTTSPEIRPLVSGHYCTDGRVRLLPPAPVLRAQAQRWLDAPVDLNFRTWASRAMFRRTTTGYISHEADRRRTESPTIH